MTINAMKVLRKIYEGRKKGYTLYLDGTRTLPSLSNNSLLIYDDDNEIVYSIRPAARPYSKPTDTNVLSTEYSQVFCFDMDCPIEDTINILNEFISQGILTEEQKADFLKQMKSTELDKGGYGELPPNKRVVQ